jgi:hypothetical protein
VTFLITERVRINMLGIESDIESLSLVDMKPFFSILTTFSVFRALSICVLSWQLVVECALTSNNIY